MCFVIRGSDPGPFYSPVNPTIIDKVIGYYMENTWFSKWSCFLEVFYILHDCIANKMKQVF